MISALHIQRNLASVRERIAAAARRANRAPESVQLVAVTKSVGPEEARALYDLGVRDFGENRVQELLRKMQALARLEVRWHFIGHLQTNKVNKVVGAVHLIHSLDSLRLAQVVAERAGRRGVTADALVEINVSGEPGKGGVQPGELASVLPQLAGLDHLRLRGLMTMAPLSEDAESARPVFARLRALRGECARLAPGPDLRHLSMGMTQDFEIAIEEGADMIRVGTALFRED